MLTPHINIDDRFFQGPYHFSMPYPGVFFLDSYTACRYFLQPQAVGEVISEEAARFGTEENGLLIFERGEPKTYPFLYELTKRLAQDAPSALLRAGFQADVDELRRLGQLDLPAYFGFYPPPARTPLGPAQEVQRIFSGAYFARTDGRWLLGIAEMAQDITPEHRQAIGGVVVEDYIVYDFEQWSAPVRQTVAQEINASLQSKASVNPALPLKCFPHYAELLALWRKG